MRFFAVLLATSFGFAQTPRFSAGLTGGVSVSRPTSKNPFAPDESRRYILGPSFEFSLTDNISLRFNPSYRRLGQTFGLLGELQLRPNEQFVDGTSRLRAHTMQLPFLGQYKFGRSERTWRLFLGAGFAFHRTFGQRQKNSYLVRNTDTGAIRGLESYPTRTAASDVGAVFSSGMEAKWKRLRFVPEFRYTQWGTATPTPFRHNRGQFDTLFSIHF